MGGLVWFVSGAVSFKIEESGVSYLSDTVNAAEPGRRLRYTEPWKVPSRNGWDVSSEGPRHSNHAPSFKSDPHILDKHAHCFSCIGLGSSKSNSCPLFFPWVHRFFCFPPRTGGMVLENSYKSKKEEARNSLSEPWRFPREGLVYKRECRSGERGGPRVEGRCRLYVRNGRASPEGQRMAVGSSWS